MPESMKTAIAGLGHIGRRHLAQYKALGVVCATADPAVTAEEAATLGSGGHYHSFAELLEAEKPQAVSICLPSHLHRANAILAMERGAHVLVEKPLALTTEDARAMLEAETATGRRLMPGHVCRFMGQYIMAHEIITGGRLGKPVFLNAWRDSATPNWSSQDWLANPGSSGSTVLDLQIHEIDLARWLLGDVRSGAMVRRQGDRFRGSGFYHVVSTLDFECGAAASLEAGHLMPDSYPASSGYRLVLEDGALEFSLSGKDVRMTLYEKGAATDLTPEFRDRFAGRYAFTDEIQHFLECLTTGEEFAVTSQDGLAAVEAAGMLLNHEIRNN